MPGPKAKWRESGSRNLKLKIKLNLAVDDIDKLFPVGRAMAQAISCRPPTAEA
jgi:hypothetical protein